MEPNWYFRQNDGNVVSIATAELCRLAETGQLAATQFIRRGNESTWRPAGTYTELKELFPAAARPIPPVPPPLLPTKPIWPLVVGSAGLLGICGFTVILLAALGRDAPTSSEKAQSHEMIANGEPLAAGEPPASALTISGEDATEDLGRLMATLTDEEKAAVGLFYLATGQDFYGARVRITNWSDVPIWVRPENVRLHLNGETVGVQSSRDPRFLQAMLLHPGHYIEGLVIYLANFEAGAAMRLGAGSISYVHDAGRND